MTSTGAKITFGNNAATTYSVNNTNFGYATGDNVGGSYSPYSQQPASSLNTVNAAGYGGVQQQRSTIPINQRGTVGQSLLNTYTSGQTVTPVTTSFENRTIPVPAQNNTKVTFGGKQFSSQFVPQQQARYEPVTNYVPPVSQYHQSYQSYQSYQRPVEITPVVATQQIQSQPIRQEVQVQQRQYQPARVSNKGSKVEATPIRESITTKGKKQKKGGCPAWLWPMLGILALLALILGLLFGLGVFGRIGNAVAGGNIQKQGQTTPTAVGTNATTTTTTPVVTTVDTTGATTTVTTPTTGTTTTQQQPGYTVMDETVVVSKNDTTSSTTQGVTSPTTTPTTTTTVDTTYTPTVTPTTYTPTYTPTNTYTPVTTVDNTYTTNAPATTTTTTDQDFGIDPSSFAPSPVAASTTTGTYSTDSNAVYTSTPYAAGTTYPTVSGYGSNPDFDFVQPTTSAQ